MHELSIAQAVVEIATANARGGRVVEVHVRVGALRQVVPPALSFAFELSALGTAAEGAELVLEEVPAAGTCRGCGTTSELEGFPLACPACGCLDVEVVSGEELVMDSLEVEHENELTRSG
jgi:hydrogenase nickel incorporation protein HypA/HybF